MPNLYRLTLAEPPRPGTDNSRVTEQHTIEAETAYKALLVLRSGVRPALLRSNDTETDNVQAAEYLTYPLSGDRYWVVDRIPDEEAAALRQAGAKILNAAKPQPVAGGSLVDS